MRISRKSHLLGKEFSERTERILGLERSGRANNIVDYDPRVQMTTCRRDVVELLSLKNGESSLRCGEVEREA